ncbi:MULTISPECIES: lysozyme [Acinetobacter]|uniref:Lysozyme n=1 Tax=Acinetobacter piscicola TaxID=2006115 RepID=A0A7S6VW07_9GAMM|nr:MULTISPECIES: lysozyme [Acinetobacter]QOW45836.1 lysozyme [Acinetobacter piscicola]
MRWQDILHVVKELLVRSRKQQHSTGIATATDADSSQIAVATDMVQRQVSAHGRELICSFEGLELTAYDDGTGCWTIGYGTTRYPDQTAVKAFDTCSLDDAKRYMQHDLKKIENAVNRAVKVNLNQHQFDALVSLTYNIGIAAFQNSTLLRYLNAADHQKAAEQFEVWVYAGGKRMQGLIHRRAAERALFEKRS